MKEDLYDHKPLHFVLGKANNVVFKLQTSLLTARDLQSHLWSEAVRFKKSQKPVKTRTNGQQNQMLIMSLLPADFSNQIKSNN